MAGCACRPRVPTTDFEMPDPLSPSPCIERLDPAMVAVYRAMSPAERIEAGLAATDMIRDRLRATFRASHPD